MNKHTPYFHKLAAAGARFQDRGGFATINFLTSIEDEHKAVRERVGIFDVYYQVGVEIKGRDAEKLLERVLVNDVRRMVDGGVLYSSVCDEDGGIVDDLTCFRFSGDRFWLSPTPSRVHATVDFLDRHVGTLNATITNLGYSNAYLSIQGPRSRELLGKLTDTDLSTSKLPYFSCTRGTVADVPGTVISRTGYSGELGYELFYPVEYAEHVWEAVSRAGEEWEIRACGMKTMRSLRIEKKYVLYGLDITTETDPISADLGWTIRFDDREFVGRKALEAIKQQGPKTRLCLLNAGGLYPIVHGEAVLSAGEPVSTVTSGDPGFFLGKTFAFAYLPVSLASEGTEVEIVVRDRPEPVTATVVRKAPYDPDRLRATV